MTKHSPITAAPAPANIIRHDGWTLDRQARFLRALAASHCVSSAARSVGMSRQSAYALRTRLKGEPFDLAWQAALLNRFDELAEAAMERALYGVEVPHYYKGELIGTSRKFDERLAIALLAMRDSFRARPAPYPSHPAATFAAEDFGPLLERVERGPQTWMEEMRQEHLELLEEEDEDYPEEDGNEE